MSDRGKAHEQIAQAFDQIPLRLMPEDFLPGMLRRDLPASVAVGSRKPEQMAYPFVLVQGVSNGYGYSPVRDGLDVVGVNFSVYTDGVDAEVDGMRLAWLVWRLLSKYAQNNEPTGEDGRSFIRVARLLERPVRRPDWADAVGPVQYQDLPTGTERHRLIASLSIHHMW